MRKFKNQCNQKQRKQIKMSPTRWNKNLRKGRQSPQGQMFGKASQRLKLEMKSKRPNANTATVSYYAIQDVMVHPPCLVI
ncbi:hypothetical protein GUJ93_ZPchr0012g19190 [Zizania palustris]|uniref:Uncharacterized protein n=1 Tax=Zizania palustris TaxID=103762 RepID=A0A8J5WNK3_ZIZPA|nr:hypothetical protein GUJ93_ZPchr0012g19190 [Zizania palustris]